MRVLQTSLEGVTDLPLPSSSPGGATDAATEEFVMNLNMTLQMKLLRVRMRFKEKKSKSPASRRRLVKGRKIMMAIENLHVS